MLNAQENAKNYPKNAVHGKNFAFFGFCLCAVLSLSGCDWIKSNIIGVNPKPAANANNAAASEFMVSTLAQIPGRVLTKTFGFECRILTHIGPEYSEKLSGTIGELTQAGRQRGADALVNLRIAPVSQVNLEGKTATVVHICGDLVNSKPQ